MKNVKKTLKHSGKQLKRLTAVARRLLEIFVSYTIFFIDDEHYASSDGFYVAGNNSYFYKNCVEVNSEVGDL